MTNMRTLVILSGLVAAATSRADAAPAWCKDVPKDVSSNSPVQAVGIENLTLALPAILQTMCFTSPGEDKELPRIEAARQQAMNMMLMTEDDWVRDVVAWNRDGRSSAFTRPASAAWSTLGPLDQWALWEGSGFAKTPLYIQDALPPTELGRAGFLMQNCFNVGPVMAAICAPDFKAIDLDKLKAEIRGATNRTGGERLRARMGFAALWSWLPKRKQEIKDLLASDPAYTTMFKLVAEARAAWAGSASSRSAQLALVAEMDDARVTQSRRAAEHCADRIWPVFQATVAALPAESFAIGPNVIADQGPDQLAIAAIVRDPAGYLAANALTACESGTTELSQGLDRVLAHWPGFRGPRTAALTALLAADLQLDRRDDKIEYPQWSFGLGIARGQKEPMFDSGSGTIASIKEHGDMIEIAFPKTSEMKERCDAEKKTHRISRIDNSGNVYYEIECTKWTPVRSDTTHEPALVLKRYAAELKPGRHVIAFKGTVVGVWPNAKSKRPLAIFGVPRK